MREDEPGALALLNKHRSEVISPAIAKHRGRTVKLMGDGLLAEFASVVEGVDCAAEIQRAIAARNGGVRGERQMAFRIGVHLGDVIVEGDDLYGDGVNIAARLKGIAERGGVCISRQAYDQVQNKLALGERFLGSNHIRPPRNLGPQNLKNIPDGRGLRHPGRRFGNCRRTTGDSLLPHGGRSSPGLCDERAGSSLGEDRQLAQPSGILGHPIWRHFFVGLSHEHRLIRYDSRGTGLSDWDVADISLNAWVNDVAAVVDAAGVDRFPLLGYSQGCAVSIAYAVRHPERVSHLVLYGGFALGALRRTAEDRERRHALTTLMRLEWGADNPSIRQMFAARLMPDATREQVESFSDPTTCWRR
jgi:hypothetical protein